jgi:hypothetical protein
MKGRLREQMLLSYSSVERQFGESGRFGPAAAVQLVVYKE